MLQKSIFVLNGPNLNLLGKRQPEIYGFKTLNDIQTDCEQLAKQLGVALTFRQTNHEGVLVDWIQEAGAQEAKTGLVINPAALTHTSVALQDVIVGTSIPTIEIHLSNLFKREEFRHHSYVSPVSSGMIFGLGAQGYLLALQAMNDILDEN